MVALRVSLVWRRSWRQMTHGCKCLVDDDPVQDLSELDDFIQQQEDESKLMPSNDRSGEMLVRLSQHWLQAGLEPLSGTNPLCGRCNNDDGRVCRGGDRPVKEQRVLGFTEEEKRQILRLQSGSKTRFPAGQYTFHFFKILELPFLMLSPPLLHSCTSLQVILA